MYKSNKLRNIFFKKQGYFNLQTFYNRVYKIGLFLERGISQPRPQGFSLKKWVGREKALASAGHVAG